MDGMPSDISHPYYDNHKMFSAFSVCRLFYFQNGKSSASSFVSLN